MEEANIVSPQDLVETPANQNLTALRSWTTPHLIRLNRAAGATALTPDAPKPPAHGELTITFLGSQFGHGPS